MQKRPITSTYDLKKTAVNYQASWTHKKKPPQNPNKSAKNGIFFMGIFI